MFQMNAARMKKCLAQGRSREECEAEIYPERSGKKTSKKSKKAPARPPRGGRNYT